jgi:WD40 repeat protein
MGVVYKACQIKANRLVALKMILAGAHAGEADLARFRTEAEAIARLEHPHIVHVYEVGEHDGYPFFSLEFCAGGSLDRHLAGTPLPPATAAQLVEMLARGVQAAHEKGIVHRDLKPANVLLRDAGPLPGTPRITDFGLAKKMDDGAGQTRTGSILGTPAYMAPEQAEGKKDLGPAVDVYALGAILYECLTGRPPFHAPTSLDTMMLVASQEPVPPSQLQPGVPRDLETITLKCLHKEPARRYATAQALADDLVCFLSGRPVAARPVSALERGWRWCRRNRMVAAMTATVAALLVLLAVSASLTAVWLNGARNTAEQNLSRANRAEEGLRDQLDQTEKARGELGRQLKMTQQAESRAGEELWQSLLARARAGRFSRRAGQRFASLDALAQAARMATDRRMPAERIDKLRNESIAAMALPDIRTRTWPGWPAGSHGLSVNGARGLYARSDVRGNVSVRRIEGDAPVASLRGDGSKVVPHFSPDGSFLVLLQDDKPSRARVWWPGQQRPVLSLGEGPAVGKLMIRPDGKQLVLYRQGTLTLYELPSGKAKVLAEKMALNLDEGCQGGFSPDNRWLAYHPVEGPVTIRDLKTGEVRQLAVQKPSRAAFSPDGRWLALVPGWYPSVECRMVLVYDVARGTLAARLENLDRIYTLSWHPDSRTLAAGTYDASLIVLWDVPTATRLKTIASQKGGAVVVRFNPTGDLLMSTVTWGGGTRLWHARAGQQLLTLPDGWVIPREDAREGTMWQVGTAGANVSLTEVHPGREYRQLVRSPLIGDRTGVLSGLAIHPGDRLVAAGSGNGAVLWDLETGDEVGVVGAGSVAGVCFDGKGALITLGSAGVLRWPVAMGKDAGEVRVGPPEGLARASVLFDVKCSHDGRVIACSGSRERGALLIHTDGPTRIHWLMPQYDVRTVAVSPDGRWVATGNHWADVRNPRVGVKVWDGRTGKLLRELPYPASAWCAFSPDGRTLMVHSEGKCRLLEAGTWKVRREVSPGGNAFSPDCKWLAGETGQGSIRLVDLSGKKERELCRLENPTQARAGIPVFTSDGARLIFASNDDQAIHVWDLRAIRRRLGDMGLDWPGAAFPAAGAEKRGRLRVQIDSGGIQPTSPAPVVPLPDEPDRKATPEEIAGWVKQLTGPGGAKERTAAAKALAEAGKLALAALRGALASGDEQARQEVRKVMERIELAGLLGTKRVRLRLRDVSVADAVKAVKEQSGLPLHYAPGAKRDEGKTIRLDLEGVPAWEAVDRLCRAAGLSHSLRGQRIILTEGTPPPAAGVAYAGPFRLVANAWWKRQALGGGTKPGLDDLLALRMTVTGIMRQEMLAMGNARATAAEDDSGRALGTPNPQVASVLLTPGLRSLVRDVSLQPVSWDSGKLVRLRGVLPVEVLAGREDLLTIPNPLQSRRVLTLRGGWLRVGAAQRAGQVVQIPLLVRGPDRGRLDLSELQGELTDSKGRTWLAYPALVAHGLQTPVDFWPEDLTLLGGGMSGGGWAGLELMASRGKPFQATVWLRFGERSGVGPGAKLVLYRTRRVRTEVPFEFRDLKLP